MEEEKIAKELSEAIKHIPKAERQSKWWKGYLRQVHEDLLKANQ
jgi:hypothetical protein